MKNQIKTIMKIGFLIIALGIFTVSCENEEMLLSEEQSVEDYIESDADLFSKYSKQVEINKAKYWFEQNEELNGFSLLEHAKSIDWSNAMISNSKDNYAIEVPLLLNDDVNVVYDSHKNLKTNNRLLFLTSELDSTYVSFLVNFISTNKKSKEKFEYSNYNKVSETFSGYISMTDINNVVVEIKEFEKGQFIKHLKMKKKNSITSRDDSDAQQVCVYRGWWYEDGHFEPLELIGCYDAGGSSDNPSNPDFGGTGPGTGPGPNPDDEEPTPIEEGDVWDDQNPYDDWNRLSDCEKDFFTVHSTFSFGAYQNKNLAENAAKELFPNCSQHNDLSDAFRHSYFAALNTQSMGYVYAKQLGDAHECDSVFPAETAMDLSNNSWGYSYASSHQYFTLSQFYSDFEIANSNGEINTLENCN